jgi:hypothetical protein
MDKHSSLLCSAVSYNGDFLNNIDTLEASIQSLGNRADFKVELMPNCAPGAVFTTLHFLRTL